MFERLAQLFGKGMTCPVCLQAVDRFSPLPASIEETARQHGYEHFGRGETFNPRHYSCPHCGASDRERLYALHLHQLADKLDGPARPRLLHFAPEHALSAFLRRQDKFDYRTADLERQDVDDRVDITAMSQYHDASFDAFICSHVLEHVRDDRAALRELHRILKPGGWGILMVPLMTHFEDTLEVDSATTEAERWHHYGQGDHVRLYAKTDFLHRLHANGFSVAQHDRHYFGDVAFRRHGISNSSVLYVVSHD